MALHWSVSALLGKYFSGAQATKCIPILAQPTMRESAMLYRASPRKTSFFPARLPKCSRIVRKSARTWVGWNSLVRPFQTGTPE